MYLLRYQCENKCLLIKKFNFIVDPLFREINLGNDLGDVCHIRGF